MPRSKAFPGPRRSKRAQTTLTRVVPAARAVPDRLITELRYSEFRNLSAAAGGDYQYNLNSCYDPNLTGTGHQPLGFDQLSALYQRYRVLKASWVVQHATAGVGIIAVAVVPTNNTTSLATNFDTACELPYSKSLLSSVEYTAIGLGSPSPPIRGSVSLAAIYGVTEDELRASDRYQALISSDPSETAVLHCCFAEAAAVSTANVSLKVLITYQVEFFDRIQLSAS